MSSAAPIVRVENIVKDFRPGFGLRRKRVLHGVSFEVRAGEIFGFVGPNGAGKTTALKVLLGLIRATEGRAWVLDTDVAQPAMRRHVGYLPENPYFYDFLTGREILDFYARLSGVPRAQRAQRVTDLLERVGLAAAGNAALRTYSKGMLQRIGIAQAIIHEPRVVFMDEPMSGLDPIGRKDVRDLILRLRAEGKTVFMNTHILHDVEMVCDRVAIIVGGRIRHEGLLEQILGGGGRESELVLSALAPAICEELVRGHAARVRSHGSHIEIRVPSEGLQPVLRRAVEAGAEVISVTPHRESLEALFVHTVEESRA